MTISAKARDLIDAIDEAAGWAQSIQVSPLLHHANDVQYERMRLGQARRALELYISEIEASARTPNDLLTTRDKVGR